jgi:hypothetical protein
MRGRNRARIALALVAALGFAACSAGAARQALGPKQESVKQRAESFGDDLRWGRFDRAAGFVLPEQRAAYWELVGEIEQRVRFTSFELREVVEQRDSEAQAIVTYGIVRPPSVQEQMLVARQRWSYHLRSGAWYVSPERAAFGLED